MHILLLSLFLSIQLPDSSKTVYGQVTNQNGEPLNQASIYIVNSKVGTITNKDGRYNLTIPDSLLNKAVFIKCKYPGMAADKDISIKLNRLPKRLNVKLKNCLSYIEEMVVPRNKKEYKKKERYKRKFERINPCD